MPFGCFGKRKKKDKDRSGKTSPVQGPNANSVANDAVVKETVAKESSPPALAVNEEVVTVARAQSFHAAAPPNSVQQRGPGANIQKSATLARYDFLRKSDYANSADRWVALKQQYLAPKMSQSSHPASGEQQQQQQQQPPPRPRRTAQSLPRQFSPPSTVVSAVKFSQWFYDRQVKEEEAHQEAQEREEKTRADEATSEAAPAADAEADGHTQPLPQEQPEQQQQQQQQQQQEEPQPQQSEQPQAEEEELDLSDPQLNEAALKIQAGFKGMQARKEVKEMQEQQHHQNEPQQNDQHEQNDQNETVDDEDPELNAAAAKIQAGFKGYKTRKEMGMLHNDGENASAEGEAAS